MWCVIATFSYCGSEIESWVQGLIFEPVENGGGGDLLSRFFFQKSRIQSHSRMCVLARDFVRPGMARFLK